MLLDPNGVIFNSVKTFVEQVGRREIWKYAELDQMMTVFNGPNALAMQFKPKVNQPHPEFPLMFCTDSQITKQAALVSEITATYNGIIDSSVLTKFSLHGGGSLYATQPVWSVNPVQGSRDFTELYLREFPVTATTVTQGNFGTPIVNTQTSYFCNAGTQSVTVRFIGTQSTCRYQACVIPGSQLPVPLGLFGGDGLKRVTWQVLSTYRGQISIAISGTDPSFAATWFSQQGFGVPPLFAAFMGGTQQQRGKWYDVTEVYGPTF